MGCRTGVKASGREEDGKPFINEHGTRTQTEGGGG